MIDNIIFVRELNAKLKYLPNKNDNSFYKTYKMFNGGIDRQIRVSNHGTYLKFWIEQDYDPAYGINISIVFTKDGTPTNDCYIDSSTNEPFKLQFPRDSNHLQLKPSLRLNAPLILNRNKLYIFCRFKFSQRGSFILIY